jgi:ABC-type branched-subunit amino acid transport system substrate-binding protein
VPVVAGRGLAAKSFLALAGVTADGLIIPGVVDPAKPSGKAFVAAYDKRFGPGDDPAHVYAALGYDSMKLLAAGLAQSGGAGGTRLAAALETLSISDAASGRAGSTLSFSTNRHQAPGRDYLVFYEIRGGTFRFLTSDVESGR